MNLEKYLIKKYDLPPDPNNLTIIDLILINYDFPLYQHELKTFSESEKDLSEFDKSIIRLEIDPKRYLMFLLSQSHFSNYIYDLYIQLSSLSDNDSNLTPTNEKTLNRLYAQRKLINRIPKLMKKIFKIILGKRYPNSDTYDLIKFYNVESIQKIINTLNFPKPNILTNNKKFNQIYDKYFTPAIHKVKNFFIKLLDNNLIQASSDKYGLANFDPNLYIYFISYRVGLNIKSTTDLDYLYNWAYEYLHHNMQKSINLVNKIYNITDTNYNNCIQRMINDKAYHFVSKNHMMQTYQAEIDKYASLIDKYNVPSTTKCLLKEISNPNKGLGSYFNNCFYLNTCAWESEKKYEVRTLVMHETYPGHHLQLDLLNNFTHNKYLGTLYSDRFTSFIEGWALFAESIHNETDDLSNFGQTDSNMLRILRIIIDIDIHYYGRSIEECISKMKKHLTMNEINIISEANRYAVLPAQALTYKIGETIFFSIYHKLSQSKSESESEPRSKLTPIHSEQMFQEYKKILLSGYLTTDNLFDKFNLKTVFD